MAALDECYVIAHHANTSDVVNAIKKGLEDDGMGDLVRQIHVSDAEGDAGAKPLGARPVQRREKFSHTEIYLPKLLTMADGQLRDFDYEQVMLRRPKLLSHTNGAKSAIHELMYPRLG